MSTSPIRIAVLYFSHETVSFLKNDTTLEDFTYPGSPAKAEALLKHGPKSYMGGFVKVAREFGAELVGIESPLWPRTGTGSGWVTEEAYETFVGRMIAELRTTGPFDGVYLCVHGAMAARGIARPEAELARRVREVVGPNVFISATFDLHGNQSDAFLKHANMGFAVKYFPHYDEYLQGERAARTLVRAIRSEYKPAHSVIRVPIISAGAVQWTGARPWMDLVQRALTWEAREPDVYVNVFFGFPFADVPDAGMTIQAMTNGNQKLAADVAKDVASFAWRRRDELVNSTKIYSMTEGVSRAKQAIAEGARPVVLADPSDRSGSATWLLAELVAQDASKALIATLADAKVTAKLKSTGAKPGDAFDMEVGGLVDESAGAPVRVKGTLVNIADGHGQTWACIKFGRDNLLVLSTYLVQIMEPFGLKALGVDIDAYDIFAIKSRVHFRRGFDDNGFAKTILLVEPEHPFLGTVRLDALPYKNVDLKQLYPYGNPNFDPSRAAGA